MSQKQRLKRLKSKTHGQLIAFFTLPLGKDYSLISVSKRRNGDNSALWIKRGSIQ